jgi:hypothetical protein
VEELDAVWDRCGIEPIRVSLGPLEPRHVRALVSELFPVGRSDEDSVAAWTEQILQAGGDIPFLLGELVRQITHLGPSEAIDAASLVLRRAATLPADGRRILDVVCVIGRWVDRRLVWTVGTLQEGAQIAIFELERARFIRISRMDGNVQVAPYHDKVREAVVAALSDEDRRELHRKVVEAMLARNQPGVDIIDHWIGAGEPAQAARAARTAAEHAPQTLPFARPRASSGRPSISAAPTRSCWSATPRPWSLPVATRRRRPATRRWRPETLLPPSSCVCAPWPASNSCAAARSRPAWRPSPR